MPLTTNFGIPPGTAARSQVANRGQSFSSMLNGSEVEVALPIPSPALGRETHPRNSPAPDMSAGKSGSRQVSETIEGTVRSIVGKESRTTPPASNAAVQGTLPCNLTNQGASADIADEFEDALPTQALGSPLNSTGPENGTASQIASGKTAAGERTPPSPQLRQAPL